MILSVLCKLIVFTPSQRQYHAISFYSEFYVSPLQEETETSLKKKKMGEIKRKNQVSKARLRKIELPKSENGI